MSQLLKEVSFLDLPIIAKGKVREMFDLGDSILMVVTDRVSAFDVVFNELIPDKGRVLNSISAFWFAQTSHIVPNHVLTADVEEYPAVLQPHKDQLRDRSMIVKKAEMFPAECIVRGYLEGSALKSYRKDGTVNGIKLPSGLVQGDQLPEPIFTPSTKAESGHDINIDMSDLCELIGEEDAKLLQETSLKLYAYAAEYAYERGIVLADTKFEFGRIDGQLVIADELFTPDSSRFWDIDDYHPGQPQKSFDKQFLREYLETLDWDKTPPAPTLPNDVIQKTAAKYREAYLRLVGHALP
ncbi:MAG: phosphoribosylaminoimidazolesuccinocarboxamide synthase [Fastidiosipilaceae bacterium]|jgi:phosphoribosylaminoimidazole-succinocarboxamide synthase|nr:phosphoribosylaminoimidazolesuccinocarboxamide synthase [Clostridiaceae bacterium]